MSLLFLLSFLFLINFSSASQAGYNYLNGQTVHSGNNYTINVNNSNYLQGYTPVTLKNWIQGLFDSIYVKLNDITNQVGNWSADKSSYTSLNVLNNGSYLNYDWNSTNTSYIPYTDANTNINLSKNNFTISNQTGMPLFFVDTNNSKVGILNSIPFFSLDVASGDIRISNGGRLTLAKTNLDTLEYLFSPTDSGVTYLSTRNQIVITGDNDANGNGGIYFKTRSNVIDWTTGTKMVIINNGNVGIGTATPNNLLVVNGNMQLLANATAYVCNITNAGAIYYNNVTFKHYGCNTTTWNALY